MEKQSLRTSAFAAITLATVAITTCLMTFPLMFHYVQRMESGAQMEIDWCYGRSRDMWRDVVSMRALKPGVSAVIADTKEAQHRQKRASAAARFFAANQEQFQYRDDVDTEFESLGVQASGGCCTCQRGPPGPPGQPGNEGRDGPNGNAGDFGLPGTPVTLSQDYIRKFPEQCPCEAEKGPNGGAGPRGNAGRPGNNGQQGGRGQPGEPGEGGDLGPAGRVGELGRAGQPGIAGGLTPGGAGPVGPGGRPGPKGERGPNGQPGQGGNDGEAGRPGVGGDLGAPGQPGPNGQPGGAGEDGDAGFLGSCDICPPARLAPGY